MKSVIHTKSQARQFLEDREESGELDLDWWDYDACKKFFPNMGRFRRIEPDEDLGDDEEEIDEPEEISVTENLKNSPVGNRVTTEKVFHQKALVDTNKTRKEIKIKEQRGNTLIQVLVDPKLKKRIQHHCVDQGIKMSDYIRNVLEKNCKNI